MNWSRFRVPPQTNFDDDKRQKYAKKAQKMINPATVRDKLDTPSIKLNDSIKSVSFE